VLRYSKAQGASSCEFSCCITAPLIKGHFLQGRLSKFEIYPYRYGQMPTWSCLRQSSTLRPSHLYSCTHVCGLISMSGKKVRDLPSRISFPHGLSVPRVLRSGPRYWISRQQDDCLVCDYTQRVGFHGPIYGLPQVFGCHLSSFVTFHTPGVIHLASAFSGALYMYVLWALILRGQVGG
jgi:hypothetical protein